MTRVVARSVDARCTHSVCVTRSACARAWLVPRAPCPPAHRGDDLTSKQLRDDLMTLLIAGHETTAAVLTWTTYLLARHPDAAERVRQEVDQVRLLPRARCLVSDALEMWCQAGLASRASGQLARGGAHAAKGGPGASRTAARRLSRAPRSSGMQERGSWGQEGDVAPSRRRAACAASRPQVLGDRGVTAEDMRRLPYTTRVINEAMRLYPQPPVLIRRALEDDVFGDGVLVSEAEGKKGDAGRRG